MEPIAVSELIAAPMESPTVELQDFDKVVQIYWPRIFRFVLASVRDRDAAESLTQDCFWRAYRSRNRFRGESSVKTWLTHIAVNLVRDFSRNRRIQFWRKTMSSSVDTGTISEFVAKSEISPERHAVVKQQLEAVWTASEALTQRQRTVFLLRFVEDMDLLEIAAATGLTEGSVKVHLFRAVHAVRKRMGDIK
jgi:RNA polymerase sigma-70 factor (ECF subfamily)